ncbi:MAG: type 4a pilus biogenesis protein PilO [Candidatus Omnitrophota bacterium]
MKKINLKEEAVKIINKVNEKNPYYLIISILVLALVLDYFLIMQFQLKAMRQLNPRIIELKGSFKQFEMNKARVDSYQKNIIDLDVQLGELEKRIKTTEEIPVVLEEISRIGNQYKFFIEQILPETSLEESTFKNNEGSYYLLPVRLEARSSYHSFGRFLNELESKGSLMKVEKITMTSNDENPRQHAIKLNIQTVIFDPVKGTKR